MFFYEGQSCPVCGQAFSETDDIVACPVCGAPHHRACWQQEGHCHFEDAHGTAQQWVRSAPAGEADPMPHNRCSNCGTENPEHAEFCSHCGRALNVQEWTAPNQQSPYGESHPCNEYAPFRVSIDPLGGVPRGETFNDATAEELAICVGNNTTYYLPRFQRIKNGRTVQWNWAAFLLTPYWLLYRKQYAAGSFVCALYLAFNLLINFIFRISGAQGTLSYQEAINMAYQAGNFPSLLLLTAAALVVCLVFGFFGNRFYLNTCLKRIRRVRENDLGDFRPALRRAGGISFIWSWLAYFIISFGSSLLSTLLL